MPTFAIVAPWQIGAIAAGIIAIIALIASRKDYGG
jgi:hypothetical protein